jgi:hypothetical protein
MGVRVQHMCNFFAGAGFMLPFFDDYDTYMRMDSDSRCPQQMRDHFQRVHETNLTYLYVIEMWDGGEVCQLLPDTDLSVANRTIRVWHGAPEKALERYIHAHTSV